jgi:hypothetical protein
MSTSEFVPKILEIFMKDVCNYLSFADVQDYLCRVSFSKLFTLFVRIFSKPMVGYIKTLQKEHRREWLTVFFNHFGQMVHKFEFRLNRLITKDNSIIQPKDLPSDTAAEKGVEMFYEMVFYAIALGVPIYEYNKSNQSALQK